MFKLKVDEWFRTIIAEKKEDINDLNFWFSSLTPIKYDEQAEFSWSEDKNWKMPSHYIYFKYGCNSNFSIHFKNKQDKDFSFQMALNYLLTIFEDLIKDKYFDNSGYIMIMDNIKEESSKIAVDLNPYMKIVYDMEQLYLRTGGTVNDILFEEFVAMIICEVIYKFGKYISDGHNLADFNIWYNTMQNSIMKKKIKHYLHGMVMEHIERELNRRLYK